MNDITDVMEEWILEKMRAKFRSEIALMKSDMIMEIVSALGGVPRHVGTKDGYEEAIEEFEIAESSGEAITNHTERPMGNRVVQLSQLES